MRVQFFDRFLDLTRRQCDLRRLLSIYEFARIGNEPTLDRAVLNIFGHFNFFMAPRFAWCRVDLS